MKLPPYGVRYPQDLIDYIEECMRLQAKYSAGAKK